MEEEKTYPIRLIFRYKTDYTGGLTIIYEAEGGRAVYYNIRRYDDDKIFFVDEESTITFSKEIIPAQKGFLFKTQETTSWVLKSVKINRNWQKHS